MANQKKTPNSRKPHTNLPSPDHQKQQTRAEPHRRNKSTSETPKSHSPHTSDHNHKEGKKETRNDQDPKQPPDRTRKQGTDNQKAKFSRKIEPRDAKRGRSSFTHESGELGEKRANTNSQPQSFGLSHSKF